MEKVIEIRVRVKVASEEEAEFVGEQLKDAIYDSDPEGAVIDATYEIYERLTR